MLNKIIRAIGIALFVLTSLPAFAAGGGGTSGNYGETAGNTLFTNVNIFNGTENKLYKGMNVLVEGKTISSISSNTITASDGTTVIDGGGKTLMPGMIDGHAHLMINADYGQIESNMDLTDLAYRATVVAERFLMDGFTAVRDMGGPTFGLQRNINNGLLLGPKVFPSGAFISQTSGHGDFRERSDGGFNR